MFKIFLKSVLFAVLFIVGISVNSYSKENGKILVVLSSSDHLTLKDGRKYPTGYFLSEFIVPVNALINAGYHIDCATPDGVKPAMDKGSDSAQYFKDESEYKKLKKLNDSLKCLKKPIALKKLSDAKLKKYDAVFFPGGHAPMEDLSSNSDVGRVLKYFHDNKKPTALICHGPAALLSAKNNDGSFLYKGYKMTVFSTEEEKIAEKGMKGKVPYYLDQALKRKGAVIPKTKAWSPTAVKDRELITGKNPMSDRKMTDILLSELSK